MKKVKKIIKESFPLIFNSYIEVKKIRNKIYNLLDKPILLLLYHRVDNLTYDPQKLAVSIENFEKQMKFIKNNFPVLHFEESWDHIMRPSIVITFDDGYADNYYNALPILEKYEIPATIFVATGNINKNNEFWWDELEKIVLSNSKLPPKIEISLSKGRYEFFLRNEKERIFFYRRMHFLLKNATEKERDFLINDLKNKVHSDETFRRLYRTMNSEELYNLSLSPYITIGGHTVSHICLSKQSVKTQEYEINRCKKDIENIIGKKVNSFSYPFGGKEDYDKTTVSLLKAAGYKRVAANFSGQYHYKCDEYRIPRAIIRNWNLNEFENNLKRLWYL